MNKEHFQQLERACALLTLAARKSNQTDLWKAIGQIRSALDGFTDEQLSTLARLEKRTVGNGDA